MLEANLIPESGGCGWQLSLNNTGVAVVTVSLPGNTTLNRYGTPVAQTSSVTFLYGMQLKQLQIRLFLIYIPSNRCM